ncbi:MAG: zinc-binding dehydrogenase [Myxococcales bacterium]|nr:zinc-binding dehydrogenase [Myxococcales bacterium]
MRQVWIPKKVGGPGVLQVREAPDPTPGPGQVSIDVAYSGVNFADIMARMGLYPDSPPRPCVVGYEVSGTIRAVGDGVTGFTPGQRVVCATRFGGYTDVLVSPANLVVALSEAVDLQAAAALPVNYLTAWIMLVHLGNVQPGERVLVHSAGGGVGLAALQICQQRGAEVFGTASASKHERLRAAGVAHCIDYRTQDFQAEVMRLTGGEGVDHVLDAQGGKSFSKSYDCLRDFGRLYCFGAASFAPGTTRNPVALIKGLLGMRKWSAFDLMDKNRGVFGVNVGHLWHRADALRAMLDQIVALTADGTFAPVVDAVFPLDQTAEAHAHIQARKNFGKVLLQA